MVNRLKIVFIFTMIAALISVYAVIPVNQSIAATRKSEDASSLNMNNKDFGTWNNTYEIKSYTALSQNIHYDTMLVLGSSEFNHGEDTIYHAKNLFEKKSISLMLIGHIYNESLNQTITLGALADQLQNKKVVFVLSPTWFDQIGVPASGYKDKFSESNYMEFLMNKSIPQNTKKYVASRTEKLLAGSTKLLNRVKRYDKIYISKTGSNKDKEYFEDRLDYLEKTEVTQVTKLLKSTKINKKSEYTSTVNDSETINWTSLENQAITESSKTISKKHYNMDESTWKSKYGKTYTSYANKYKSLSFNKSPEYSDLEAFLNVCKSEGIETELIMQPLNGYWYDYCGLTKGKRAGLMKKVAALGKKYNAEVVDFSNYDYKPYFLIDNVHPWGLGWVKMDKAIYSFYNK